MSEINKNKIYHDLPLIYDHLMRKIRYDYWADYLFHITSKYISKKADVLELAAGNCRLAKYLVKKYPNLIASDLSIKMLANSKDKTIKKVCCDMISIPFKKHFNLIYSTFDSINYILAKNKLLYFLNGIAESLSNNGIFTFDVSLEKNSIEHVSRPVRSSKFMGCNYVHKSIYDERSRIHKNIFSIILPDGKILKEIHRQKILDFEEYFDLIDKAKLYVVECLDAFTFNDGKADSKRVQFVVKKV